jgi:hypothetical protein
MAAPPFSTQSAWAMHAVVGNSPCHLVSCRSSALSTTGDKTSQSKNYTTHKLLTYWCFDENLSAEFPAIAELSASMIGTTMRGSAKYMAKVPSTAPCFESSGCVHWARSPWLNATSRKSTHKGSLAIFDVITDCFRNAAVPHDPTHGPIVSGVMVADHPLGTRGPAVGIHVRIPFLAHRTQGSIAGLDPDVQLQMRTAFRPLQVLRLTEPNSATNPTCQRQ